MVPPSRRAALAACLLATLLAAPAARAQTDAWPSRPVKFVVAYPPGGGADVTARLFAEHLALGQRVVVENRSGAGGRLGATSVVKADPDGYTLLVAAISEISIAPATVRDMPYDPTKDLAPVALLARWAQILVAAPSFPPASLGELIAHAKANPGKTRYGSFGNGTLNHVAGERLKLATGIDSVHVPYRGSGQMLIDVIAGQVDFAFDTPAATLQHIRGGKLKALAIGGTERYASAPEIPTAAEAGLPGFEVQSWIGLMAPAATPRAIVERLNREVNAALAKPELRRIQDASSVLPGGGTPEAFGAQIRAEIADYRRIVTEAKIELE